MPFLFVSAFGTHRVLTTSKRLIPVQRLQTQYSSAVRCTVNPLCRCHLESVYLHPKLVTPSKLRAIYSFSTHIIKTINQPPGFLFLYSTVLHCALQVMKMLWYQYVSSLFPSPARNVNAPDMRAKECTNFHLSTSHMFYPRSTTISCRDYLQWWLHYMIAKFSFYSSSVQLVLFGYKSPPCPRLQTSQTAVALPVPSPLLSPLTPSYHAASVPLERRRVGKFSMVPEHAALQRRTRGRETKAETNIFDTNMTPIGSSIAAKPHPMWYLMPTQMHMPFMRRTPTSTR